MTGMLSPEGPSPVFILPTIERGLLDPLSRNDGGRLESMAVGTKFCTPELSSVPEIDVLRFCKVSGGISSAEDVRLTFSSISTLISMSSGRGCSVLISSLVYNGASAMGCLTEGRVVDTFSEDCAEDGC